MTLRQLAYLVAVVEEGSMTRAARRLGITQPSLSQQLRALEREVGGDLVERLPRSLRLTPAGRAFLPHARAAIRAAARADRVGAEARNVEGGSVELCITRSLAVGALPRIARAWLDHRPLVALRPIELGAGYLEEQMRAGVGDLGLGPPPADWAGALTILGWEEWVVVLAPGDPLASGPRLPLSALAERDWVMFQQEDETIADLIGVACLALGGFVPRRGTQTSQVETAARLAAVGAGPTLVPRSTVPADLAAATIPTDPPVGRAISAFCRPKAGALVSDVMQLLGSLSWPVRPPDAFSLG